MKSMWAYLSFRNIPTSPGFGKIFISLDQQITGKVFQEHLCRPAVRVGLRLVILHNGLLQSLEVVRDKQDINQGHGSLVLSAWASGNFSRLHASFSHLDFIFKLSLIAVFTFKFIFFS